MMMNCKLFLVTILILCSSFVYATSRNNHKTFQQYNEYGITKLFVFGDSYADTGNLHFMWNRDPYGYSLGKPRGRYSDGFLLTDYVAKFLRLKSPAPYHWRKYEKSNLHYGMNFAYGGAGVFATLQPRPNISVQIDLFENLLNDGVFTKFDLQSSLVLFTLAGNDYDAYLEKGGDDVGLMGLVGDVTDALAESLGRISKLGAKRVAMGSLQAMGCLPYITQPNFKECNSTGNLLSLVHNEELGSVLDILNKNRLGTNYTFIDIEKAMNGIFSKKEDITGKLKFPDPLRPCCMGVAADTCGTFGPKGEKLYEVCKDPNTAFFWDSVHPTQAGWKAIFNAVKPSFEQISSFN